VKGYGRKKLFGFPAIVILVGTGFVMLSADNSNELFLPIVFVFAFAGGVTYWLVINSRESKRRKEENAKRKFK